jgi:hypothetical protein
VWSAAGHVSGDCTASCFTVSMPPTPPPLSLSSVAAGYFLSDGTLSHLLYPNGTLIVQLPEWSLGQSLDVALSF